TVPCEVTNCTLRSLISIRGDAVAGGAIGRADTLSPWIATASLSNLRPPWRARPSHRARGAPAAPWHAKPLANPPGGDWASAGGVRRAFRLRRGHRDGILPCARPPFFCRSPCQEWFHARQRHVP